MEFRDKKFSLRRFSTLLVVLSVHLGGIFIPLGLAYFIPQEPKPIPFRVKLGGDEPSHAPELGPPERRPPSVDPGGGTPPPPPPPEDPVPPPPPVSPPKVPPTPPPPPPQEKPVKPVVPKPDIKKIQAQKKRQEQARRKKLLEQKKRKEQERRKKLLEQKKRQEQKKRLERRKKLLEQKKREEQARRRADWLRRQAEKRKREQQQVHHDSRWDSWDPNKKPGGGSNFNKNVRTGSRDRGQAIGPVDGRTPAGGATEDVEKYWGRIQEFFYERWNAPAGIFVTAETAVTIEVTFDRRGKVLSKRIIKRSPNAAVNQSAQVMLDKLDYIPTPPAGVGSSFKLNLVSQ